MMQTKLPRGALVELEKMKPEDEARTIKNFRKLLKRHINALEASDTQMKLCEKQYDHLRSPNESHKQSQYLYNSSTKPFTGEGLLSNKKTISRYGQKCIFCGDDHWIDECWRYRDIQ